ncbi:homeobox-leucine zipper protein ANTHOCYANINLESS 2-like [Bidens hawaiensis]|uniref:homeobox-leucine zipper protein ANTHOCYANINLESS 2-like n=1 Tax=Bidens hawaiensis TaxID=980011 RepID=UPI004049CC89
MAGRFNSSRQRVEGNDNQRAREEVPATTPYGHDNFEVSSSDEQEVHRGGASSSSRKVHYSRHTPHQIAELEKCFQNNDHPNEKERREITRKLNIELKKAQTERHENSNLRQQNELLRLEVLALKEVVKNPLCVKCGAQATISGRPIHVVTIENVQLREELSRMSNLYYQFFGKHSPLASQLLSNISYPNEASKEDQEGGSYNHGSLNPVEAQSQMGIDMPIQTSGYIEQASNAMEELFKSGLVNAPLWNRNAEGGGETLNFEEYAKSFPPCLGRKPLGFVSDATRANSVVPISSSTLVEALLDADQWREMFSSMIGSCTIMEVISNGTGGSRNGALQLNAEIQLISPEVPARVFEFIRFAKQQAEGLWVVVDVSVDYELEAHLTRRCPSGCILRDMPNGFTMVTWIEHVVYNELPVSHEYRQLIRSGIGFGAQRWIGALLRHCEGLSATTSPTLHPNLYQNMKIRLKGLARRMTSNFCAGVCLTGGQQWEPVVIALGRPRIMARKCIHGLGEPFGIVTSASFSVWIPTNHQHLFSLWQTKDLRCLWDAVCHTIATDNMIHFPLSQDESSPNCISILNSNASAEDNQIMVLQETSSDMTGSFIVYAALDSQTVSAVMSGEDTSSAALLPSGISIVPGYGKGDVYAPGDERGSMVTIGYRILHPNLTTSDLTMEIINSINGIVSRTALGIREIVRSSSQ